MNNNWKIKKTEDIYYVLQENGPVIGCANGSGVTLIEENGLVFKDLNNSKSLDRYEDWRLSAEERAEDLASKMTIEEIAGLMLYSSHQMVPSIMRMFAPVTYKGKSYKESGAAPYELTDQQKEFLEKDNLRHVLVTSVQDIEVGAKWSNELQKFCEATPLGIPVNISSDPRHGIDSSKEFNLGGGMSCWPEEIGMAATFEPELIKEFGEIASKEYRAMGITTALSPQVDLATDPRWGRFNGTFGGDAKLATDMSRAYCEGFQTSVGESEISNGWGYESVNAMVKHWPGGGTGEGGRDAHFNYGQYAVYPGDNFEEHLKPFVEGAFNLKGGTKKASAVMPYYTISHGIDQTNNENVGNAFSTYIIKDLLRDTYGYDGVVCTDWAITSNAGPEVETFSGKCWGVEELSVVERHLKVILAGCDQFGGNNDAGPIIEAYSLGVKEFGETTMRKRFEASAIRLLKNIFRLGLFENPYLDIEESLKVVRKDKFIRKGFEAQLKSLVLLKNKNHVLPIPKEKKIYIPKQYSPEKIGWFGNVTKENEKYPIDMTKAKEYYDIVEDPDEADYGLVFARGPVNVMLTAGYDADERKADGTGYVPISLQYRPYMARHSRTTSLAGGDMFEEFDNRSYHGKTVTTYNERDLDNILETKTRMGNKPVIVVLQLERPAVINEFEARVDGIIVDYGVDTKAIFEMLIGNSEFTGLLPMQIPVDMETVEKQLEDVSRDMDCHVDSEGNTYDFGYGLSYKGIICDERTKKYL